MRAARPIVCSALLLAACGGGKSTIEPPAPLVDFSPTAAVKRAWSVDLGKGEPKKFILLAPILDGQRIYATDVTGRVGAFTVDSGRQLWRQIIGEPVAAPVGFGEGLVLVGTEKAHVIAFDAQSGAVRWKSTVSSEVLGRPSARAGVVVVQTVDGRVFGFSARDGSRLWMGQRTVPPLSLRGTSSPLITGGLAVTGFANGKVVAVNLNTGREVWERTVAEPRGRNEIERLVDVDAPPVVSGNLLFAASYQGRIIAVNLDNGRELWTHEISTYTGMAVDQTNLYLTDAEGNVVALDQHTGTTLWTQDKLHARALNAPTLVGEYVAVGDFEGYVHFLVAQTGEFAVRTRIGRAPIRGPGIASDSTLFIQDEKGKLTALRIEARPRKH